MTTLSATRRSQIATTPPPPRDDVSAMPHRRHAVEIIHVTKSFGPTVAVNDLSLKVREQSICGFIGPNGSGKTTTLRMIMRIYRPDEGAGLVRVLGQEELDAPPKRVGYLPEERGLYNRMTVRDILRFYAELKGVANVNAAVDAWIERMHIADATGRRVDSLSKGNTQKVQFITAVIDDPRLLILDEPFSGLDPVSADLLHNVILDLRQQGTTIIYSTHDMNMAERMCDDVIMIYRGIKVLDGRLEDIKREFGTDTIRVRLDHDHVSLNGIEGVAAIRDFGRVQELRMTAGYKSQRVLRDVMERGRVLQFEVSNPSLHDVFVRLANTDAAEAQDA